MAAEVTIDYYAVLHVSPSADRHTIRSSYIKLAKQYHPDKNINNPEATALFQSLEAAYSILYDIEKRCAYDYQHTLLRKSMAHNMSIEDLLANISAECLRLAEECQKLSERLSQLQNKTKKKKSKKVLHTVPD
uniref:J domain-containing protein n=1 Tax=Bionectria ochroleuca TaxID=29856 RepID=A0A0B7KJ94_BIOOC